MAEISRIKLSNGEVYEIKDTETRRLLELLLGKPDEGDNENSEE